MFDLAEYYKARSVDEAVDLLSQNPEAVPIAGGTDVLVRLREGHEAYRRLVDIHDLPELKGVRLEPDGAVFVGAGATFTDLIRSEVVARHVPVLAEAAALVAGPQIQNVATIGGNICNGAPSADGAAPLLVHEAEAVLKGLDGSRQVPLKEFYLGPGRVDRRQNEIMLGLRIAADDHQGWTARYHKYAMREAMDIATIGCAAACRVAGGRLEALRLAYIVAGPVPLRCPKTEAKVQGAALGPELLEILRDSVLDDLKPRDSWRAAKDFREHIIRVLAQRVVARCLNLE